MKAQLFTNVSPTMDMYSKLKVVKEKAMPGDLMKAAKKSGGKLAKKVIAHEKQEMKTGKPAGMKMKGHGKAAHHMKKAAHHIAKAMAHHSKA